MTGYLFPFKLTVVPLLIWLISHAGRKWGPVVAGSLSAFPVVVGPTLLFIALERGREFAASAAVGSVSGVFALISFSLAYAWASTRLSWVYSIMTALLAYTASVVALNAASLSLYTGALAVVSVLAVIRRFLPEWQKMPEDRPKLKSEFRQKRVSDVPVRMLVGGCLVYGLIIFAGKIGPAWSGIFSMFPVTGSVLLVFSHIFQGREFAINLVHGMFLGWCSISLFCVLVSVLLQTYSIPFAFTAALISAVAAQYSGFRLISLKKSHS